MAADSPKGGIEANVPGGATEQVFAISDLDYLAGQDCLATDQFYFSIPGSPACIYDATYLEDRTGGILSSAGGLGTGSFAIAYDDAAKMLTMGPLVLFKQVSTAPLSGTFAGTDAVFFMFFDDGQFIYHEQDAVPPNGWERGTFTQGGSFTIYSDKNDHPTILAPGNDGGIGDGPDPIDPSPMTYGLGIVHSGDTIVVEGSLVLTRK